MDTTADLLAEGTSRLREAGSESARLDAELLLADAIGVGRTAVVAHPEAPVGADASIAFRAGLARREAGEPVAYIRGLKEFYGLAFQVDRRALIPRPETERLVGSGLDEVWRRLGARSGGEGVAPVRIVDVGTGSGAVAIAIAVTLRKRNGLAATDIVATDVSPDALGLARENAVGHAVADSITFVEADLLPTEGPLAGPFDVVLANLPYVRHDAMAGLPRATSFEPSLALDGGDDGLVVVERLLARLPETLLPAGVALFEIGSDQGETIVATVARVLPGWSCTVQPDLAGLPRVAHVTPASPS